MLQILFLTQVLPYPLDAGPNKDVSPIDRLFLLVYTIGYPMAAAEELRQNLEGMSMWRCKTKGGGRCNSE